MKKRHLFAAFLILTLLLYGCGPEETGGLGHITIEEPVATVVPAAYNPSQREPDPDADGTADFFSEESTDYYNGEAMPAPPIDMGAAPEASDENGIREVAPSAASPGVNLAAGDITMGVVVSTDADINPLSTDCRDFINIDSLVYESLVELNENMRPQPQLADRWTFDGDLWTFTLRSGIVFHDGAALTANDVVASYQEILNHPTGKWYSLVSHISAMRAVDDLTLEVKSASEMGYFTLYCMTFPVVSAASIAAETPMGTGAYWFIDFSRNNALRLESNPLWWRRASGGVESIVAIFYPSTKAAMQALETGEIDTLATESATASLSKNLSDRVTVDFLTQTYECLLPNLDRQIMASPAVRKAIMYAIDRTTVVETVYAGLAQESEVPVQPGTWLHDPQSTKYNFSPERALYLLYEDGWSDPDGDGVLQKEMEGSVVRLEISLATYDRGTTTTRTDAANLIAEQLKTVGFAVTVETVSTSDVLPTLRNGKFDLALVAFELSELPELSFLLYSSGNCNYSRYTSASMDTLLREAFQTTDEEALKNTMGKIQLQIVEELPVMGLFFRSGILICKQSLGGIVGSRQGNVLRGIATAIRD
ncbi:MAG: peptide ABC transporter substrate-binding protein [Christensenellales bacterium]